MRCKRMSVTRLIRYANEQDRGVSNEAFGKDTPAYSDQADDSKEEDSTGNSEQVNSFK